MGILLILTAAINGFYYRQPGYIEKTLALINNKRGPQPGASLFAALKRNYFKL
jgi:hypothetical protein